MALSVWTFFTTLKSKKNVLNHLTNISSLNSDCYRVIGSNLTWIPKPWWECCFSQNWSELKNWTRIYLMLICFARSFMLLFLFLTRSMFSLSLFLSLSHLSASLSTHIFSIREKCEGFFFNVCVCTCVYVWCAKGSFFNVQITILELFWCQFHQHFSCTFFCTKVFCVAYL